MKKVIAKSYSVERIADIYLAALEKVMYDSYPSLFLSEVLRKQNIFYDKPLIENTLQLLEDRGYIFYTGLQTGYFLSSARDFESLLPKSYSSWEDAMDVVRNPQKYMPPGEHMAMIKEYKITGHGARFVRMGQVLDTNGKTEREAERKKWKERWITWGGTLFISVASMFLKWYFFDRK